MQPKSDETIKRTLDSFQAKSNMSCKLHCLPIGQHSSPSSGASPLGLKLLGKLRPPPPLLPAHEYVPNPPVTPSPYHSKIKI